MTIRIHEPDNQDAFAEKLLRLLAQAYLSNVTDDLPKQSCKEEATPAQKRLA